MVPPAGGVSSEIESFWYMLRPRLLGQYWPAQALFVDMCVFKVLR